ncbi:hypothetical protein [Burkholderia cepacia]|uniref:hypothetical protein n=1 Tax=Burkholderia cepacia TaxID=292 RepID=UPI00075EFD68|nr:hypothetical protein [Burkholderia cepacia]KWH52552.1 hypothetical protein WM00_19505 [Burkholderia cepacia]
MFVLMLTLVLLQAGRGSVLRIRAEDVLVKSAFRARVVIEKRTALDATARADELSGIVRSIGRLPNRMHPIEEFRLIRP